MPIVIFVCLTTLSLFTRLHTPTIARARGASRRSRLETDITKHNYRQSGQCGWDGNGWLVRTLVFRAGIDIRSGHGVCQCSRVENRPSVRMAERCEGDVLLVLIIHLRLIVGKRPCTQKHVGMLFSFACENSFPLRVYVLTVRAPLPALPPYSFLSVH